MKAAELRIGNWIQSSSNKEYQINLSWYECCKDSTEGRDIQLDTLPIPLTEEWLIKFGFKKHHLYSEQYNKDNYSIVFCKGNCIDFWIADCDDCGVAVKIPFVHQLQNLYFALTGEELTIK